MTQDECREAMIQICSLKTDWDDAGADPIDVKVIANAWSFLANPLGLPLPDRITPAPDGNITFAWIDEEEGIGQGPIPYVAGECSFDGSGSWRFRSLGGILAKGRDGVWKG